MEKAGGRAQFIIAKHSLQLIYYPGPSIYQFDEHGISEIDYKDTEQFTLMKSFLDNP